MTIYLDHTIVPSRSQVASAKRLAELLGVPVGTVRSRLHRARLELRGLLAQLDAENETTRGRGERPPPDPN